MTEELHNAIKKEMEEEKNGYDHYMELANKAECEGCYIASGVLKDIAHEEHTHHDALKHILEIESHR